MGGSCHMPIARSLATHDACPTGGQSGASRRASVIVFDLDFSRPRSGDEDAEFAQAIERTQRVLLLQPLDRTEHAVRRLGESDAAGTWLEEKLVAPAPKLAAAAGAL